MIKPFSVGDLVKHRQYRGIIFKRLENRRLTSYRLCDGLIKVKGKYTHTSPSYAVHWFNNTEDKLPSIMYHNELIRLKKK